MKKAFTLIELLIVVAIIGILAGVGIPMYNGYLTSAKINCSKENHKTMVNFTNQVLLWKKELLLEIAILPLSNIIFGSKLASISASNILNKNYD